jgi:hypothetical protein
MTRAAAGIILLLVLSVAATVSSINERSEKLWRDYEDWLEAGNPEKAEASLAAYRDLSNGVLGKVIVKKRDHAF